jgi:hypothetical protein
MMRSKAQGLGAVLPNLSVDAERGPIMKTYLCVVDVLPSGRIAALEVTAMDAISAERTALQTGNKRYGSVEVLEVLRTDVEVPAA